MWSLEVKQYLHYFLLSYCPSHSPFLHVYSSLLLPSEGFKPQNPSRVKSWASVSSTSSTNGPAHPTPVVTPGNNPVSTTTKPWHEVSRAITWVKHYTRTSYCNVQHVKNVVVRCCLAHAINPSVWGFKSPDVQLSE